MLEKFKKIALVVAAVSTLAACNDGNSGSGTPIVTIPTPPPTAAIAGKASLGALNGATCTAAPASNPTQTLGSPGTTNADGTFSVPNVSAQPSPFPVIITCTGGSYFDEGTGTSVPNTSPITSIGSGTGAVGVSVLTTLAADALLKLPAEARTTSAAASAFKEIADVFAPGFDISAAPATVSAPGVDLGTDSASQLAVILASFSYAAKSSGLTLAQLLTSLKSDLSDGKVDGKNGDAPISGYSSLSDLVSKIDAGTDSFAADNPASADSSTAASNTTDSNPRSDGTVTPTTTGST